MQSLSDFLINALHQISFYVFYLLIRVSISPITNIPKWSNTLKQFVGNSQRIVWVSLTILYFLCNFNKKATIKNAWLTSLIVNIPQKSSLKPFIPCKQPSNAQVAEVTKRKKKWKFCDKLKHLREELGKSTKRILL